MCVPLQVLALVYYTALRQWGSQEDLPEVKTVQGPVPGPPEEDWSFTGSAAVLTF